MSALTPSTTIPTVRESLGSVTLLTVPLTTLTSSDTYTIQAGSPVVNFWSQGNTTSGDTGGDISYVQSTGIFTIASSSQGALTLFILMRT